jgi:hypothetical protein
MIPQEAIEKAIQGGWLEDSQIDAVDDGKCYFQTMNGGELSEWQITWEEIALDPSFWQSLGKALGWPLRNDGTTEWWGCVAADFCRVILTGGDTDKFWKEILQ